MSAKAIIQKCRPKLRHYEDIYRDLHQHPDLSLQEARTASIVARHLRSLNFDVRPKIGGEGVVGILNNGPGKTVLLRPDMDALPIRESTGLNYASTKTAWNAEGKEIPVMHACGHDMHTTALIATATLLQAARHLWTGTLICLFQPNEETVCGAQAMVDDGLYTRHQVPVP